MTFGIININLVNAKSQGSPSLPFFIIFVVMAAITWFAAATRREKLFTVINPLVMLPLIIWFIMRGRTDPPYLFFIIGLSLSLLGDIALSIFAKTAFFNGMVFFALAHLSYAIGYYLWPTAWFSFGNFLFVPALLILFGTLFYRPASSSNPKIKFYFKVAWAYTAFILTMLVMAGACFGRQGWSLIPAAMTFVGAILFVASDVMIAVEKFEYTQKNLRFWVISSYHLSQFLIASSVLYVANGGFYF